MAMFVLAGPTVLAAEVPLIIGHRTIHVFRGALGDLSAEERAAAAYRHITEAVERGGEGWMSIRPVTGGVAVTLDGEPMLTVTSEDARGELDESPEKLANRATRVLRKVWSEQRERRAPGIAVVACLKVVAALSALIFAIALFTKVHRAVHGFVVKRVAARFPGLLATELGSSVTHTLLRISARGGEVLLWLSAVVAVFVFILYSFQQFVVTRPLAENLLESFKVTLLSVLRSTATALPGLFVAIIIFIAARIVAQLSRAIFEPIAAGRLNLGALDAHTAPAARYLVNGGIWLFALAMSYPYLPGSHTEAFKGLSVLLGLMVSIGASGLIGQIASGMILVFTRALLVGEYVRIQDCEGRVTRMGLCVTRLRTGTGEEISLPNALVLSHVTRNFSRNAIDVRR